MHWFPNHFQIELILVVSVAANDLRISPTTGWRVAKAAKLKPYEPFKTNLITPQNTQMRYTFSLWFVGQRRNLARSIIFSDEKFWVIDAILNSKNRRTWAVMNPRNLIQCRYLMSYPERHNYWAVLVCRPKLSQYKPI